MISLGYMAKRVVMRPECLENSKVDQILSVSSCISDDFADYVNFWRHNGFWFFDSPKVIVEVASEQSIDISGLRWFYYEAHEEQYNEDEGRWEPYTSEASFETSITIPSEKRLKGFDIVNLTCGQMVECSPISCNHLAEEIKVNSDCLLDSWEEARDLVSSATMDECEPGPYRILAVFEVAAPNPVAR